MRAKPALSVLLVILGIFFAASCAFAASWSYNITSSDTPTTIDFAETSAEVDTSLNEIRLPKHVPKIAAFWYEDDYYDYIVLAGNKLLHFSYDGANMVENTVLEVGGLTNPVAAITAEPYPDVVVATQTDITHYSFDGSGMCANPALSVAGLANIVSIGTRQSDVAALTQEGLNYFGFTGTEMSEIPSLSVSGLSNPIDMALFQDTYDCVVLEPGKTRYFNYADGMVENPSLAITGLAQARSISVSEGDIAIAAGGEVKHYQFDGSGFSYQSALSVASGLVSPQCVALRPGTNDKLIIDGDEIKYYMFDGSQMVYNPGLSAEVAGLQDAGNYSSSAIVQSLANDPGVSVNHVRVMANHTLSEGTAVTYSVTADGTNWVKKWRVRGIAGGTVCEISNDNGSTWANKTDNSELWTEVTPGRSVKWRAELTTVNPLVTPKVLPAITVETGNKPNPPVVSTPGTCYKTTTPTFTWTFSDPDPGDTQTACQVLVKRRSDGALVYDSGKVASSQSSFRMPTSTVPDVPGPLWSSGSYQFTLQARVWDSADLPSDWSAAKDFCVVAFERPRIQEIISAPTGQVKPLPDDPATHILVTEGMSKEALPKTKAGGKVVVLIDSVGPISDSYLSIRFPYLTTQATVGNITLVTENGINQRRAVEFWTSADLEACPAGTLIKAEFSGSGSAGPTDFDLPPYAAGIVTTEGTVYSDWFVVLQGRK